MIKDFAAGAALAAAVFLGDGPAWPAGPLKPGPAAPGLTKVVMGYYPSWNRAAFDQAKIDFKNLTHIAIAFAKPNPEGGLVVPPECVYPALNGAAHKNGVKVILSVGGWGNCEGFPGMASSQANRKRFITQAVNFCRKNRFDGVDLDWEFVSNEEERRDFSSLVKELSAAFRAKRPPLQLSMAAPAGDYYGRWIAFEEIASCFDYIGFMTYDFHGSWSDHSGHNSPLYASLGDECGSVHESYIYARTVRRIPNNKLLLGIPFYGRSFDCAGLRQGFTRCGDYSYAETRKLPASEWDSCWDGVAKVPWLRKKDLSEIICFDGVRSVALKCRYVKAKKAAGVIIWEISQDYVDGASPLLRSVGREFRK